MDIIKLDFEKNNMHFKVDGIDVPIEHTSDARNLAFYIMNYCYGDKGTSDMHDKLIEVLENTPAEDFKIAIDLKKMEWFHIK